MKKEQKVEKNVRCLKLNRETLRKLETSELKEAAGGAVTNGSCGLAICYVL